MKGSLVHSTPLCVRRWTERGSKRVSDVVLPVHVVGWAIDWIAILVEQHVHEVLIHCLIEWDCHWGVTLHAKWGGSVKNRGDWVTRQSYRLVSLGIYLNCGCDFICVNNLAFVALEMTTWNEDSLTEGALVLYKLVKLTLLKAEFVCSIVIFGECRIDELKACIDYLVAFDGVYPIRLSKQVHVWGLLNQKEELVFDNGMNLARASKEWSFLNWFHYGPHRHCIVVLVSHHRWTLDEFARDATSSKGNLARNLR